MSKKLEIVVSKSEFLEIVLPKSHKNTVTIGANCVSATKKFKEVFEKNEALSKYHFHGHYSAYDSHLREGKFTIQSIIGIVAFIMCDLFDKKSLEEEGHTLENLREFFQAITPIEGKIGTDDFEYVNAFIQALLPHSRFKDDNIELNSDWKIEISDKEAGTESPGSEDEPKVNPVVKGSDRRLNVSKGRLAIIIGLVCVVGLVAFAVYQFKKYTDSDIKLKEKKFELEQNELSRQEILEIKKGRKQALSNLYNSINVELSSDYKNDGVRNLSQSLIARIVSLSHDFTPYKEDSLRSLSPERGDLLFSLFQYNLSDSTINSIASRANFSYSDLSNKDLKGFDWCNFNGITGRYHREVDVLVTEQKRIKLDHSNFDNADLSGACIFADLESSTFINTTLHNTEFLWSNMDYCNFEGVQINDCSLRWLNLMHTNFKSCEIISSAFVRCDLRGANFKGANLSAWRDRTGFYDCFLSSKGTFFEYSVQLNPSNAYIIGEPYMEESKIHSDDAMPIIEFKSTWEVEQHGWEVDDSLRYITGKVSSKNGNEKEEMNYIIHPNFLIFDRERFDIKRFYSALQKSNYQKPVDNVLNTYTVRTRDNFERGAKFVRNMYRFAGVELDAGPNDWDTLVYESREDYLVGYYRGKKYSFSKTMNSSAVATASFENANMEHVSFVSCEMNSVSFRKALLEKDVLIQSSLINNCDFRVDSGSVILESCLFKTLRINDSFQFDSFSQEQKKLLEREKDRLINKYEYVAPMYIDVGKKYAKGIRRW